MAHFGLKAGGHSDWITGNILSDGLAEQGAQQRAPASHLQWRQHIQTSLARCVQTMAVHIWTDHLGITRDCKTNDSDVDANDGFAMPLDFPDDWLEPEQDLCLDHTMFDGIYDELGVDRDDAPFGACSFDYPDGLPPGKGVPAYAQQQGAATPPMLGKTPVQVSTPASGQSTDYHPNPTKIKPSDDGIGPDDDAAQQSTNTRIANARKKFNSCRCAGMQAVLKVLLEDTCWTTKCSKATSRPITD